MLVRNTSRAWGAPAKALHWTIAVLILGLMVLGWAAASWPLSHTKISLFYWHKSLGMLVLALALLRVLWRLLNIRPGLPEQMPLLERRLAAASHVLLYLLPVVMPLSGWVINSAANFPFKVLGIWPLPALVPPSKTVQGLAETVHLSLFWILAALLVLHVAAALRHHWVSADGVLLRMLPVRRVAATSRGSR